MSASERGVFWADARLGRSMGPSAYSAFALTWQPSHVVGLQKG